MGLESRLDPTANRFLAPSRPLFSFLIKNKKKKGQDERRFPSQRPPTNHQLISTKAQDFAWVDGWGWGRESNNRPASDSLGLEAASSESDVGWRLSPGALGSTASKLLQACGRWLAAQHPFPGLDQEVYGG